MQPKKLERPIDAKVFALAGNARLTLLSTKTGTRFTYRVRKSDDGKVFFVSLLTGTDNENSYTYLGTIPNREPLQYRPGAKSPINAEAPSSKAWRWFVQHVLIEGEIPPHLEIWHEGHCGRCGRALTVPESIARGIGPDCAEKMGIVCEGVTREDPLAALIDG